MNKVSTTIKLLRIEKGISQEQLAGAVLAMLISYTRWQSIGWAQLHGGLNWACVLYYIIRY